MPAQQSIYLRIKFTEKLQEPFAEELQEPFASGNEMLKDSERKSVNAFFLAGREEIQEKYAIPSALGKYKEYVLRHGRGK